MIMDGPGDLALKLGSEGERLLSFFESLGQAEWDLPVYMEGAVWTVRSIVAHLMTSERAFLTLFEQIRQGGQGVGEDFDIDRYNASQQRKVADASGAELMRSFKQARSEMITWVSALAESDLEKRGQHPFLGPTSLRDMIKMLYVHNHMHYRDVRRALKA